MSSEYLGDGVYVREGNYIGEVVLTTSNGVTETNQIFLDPSIVHALFIWMMRNNTTFRSCVHLYSKEVRTHE